MQKNLQCPKDTETLKPNLDTKGENKRVFKGAEIAYESILTSFANGDLIKLKALLSPNMFLIFRMLLKSEIKKILNQNLHLLVQESSVEKYEKIKDNLFATVKSVAEVIVKRKITRLSKVIPTK